MKMFPPYESDSNVVPMTSPTGGRSMFPFQLHTMLDSVEASGCSHVVSWQPHGRCFVVHKPRDFATYIVPIYFRQTKLTSFQRQLNIYGFKRLFDGPDKGGYYHPSFLRGQPYLCNLMTRTSIKGTRVRVPRNPNIVEPNFYSMPALDSVTDAAAEAVCVATRSRRNDTLSIPMQRRSGSSSEQSSVPVEAACEPHPYGNAPLRNHGQQTIQQPTPMSMLVPQVPLDREHDVCWIQPSPITKPSHRMPRQVSYEDSSGCCDLFTVTLPQSSGLHGWIQGRPHSILWEPNPLPDDVTQASSVMSDDSMEYEHPLASPGKPLELDNQEWVKLLRSLLSFGCD